MGRSSRTKGRAFEQEIVRQFNDYQADAERVLTQVRDGGHDIDSLFGAFECKKRETFSKVYEPREGVRAVVVARNRGERLCILRLHDALRLMKMEFDARRAE